jgi:hypothetical protein
MKVCTKRDVFSCNVKTFLPPAFGPSSLLP